MQPMPQTGARRLERLDDAVTPEAAFGLQLRRAREQEGVSLREMARRLTRSHSNLWDYERGHRLATAEVVAEYERELGLAEGELQGPLEAARRQVYGMDRERRRPFRPPAPVRRGASRPPGAGEGGRAHSNLGGPFVGRDQEMATVQAWLDHVEAGEPRIILLSGDAGIGKSTLLAHVLDGVRRTGWLVLSGSCLQGARIAYLPLASALTPLRPGRHLSGLAPATLSQLFLGEEDGSNGVESDIAADRRHLSLFVAITRALLEAADQGPILLAIEDLHWADDSTLAFLEHLAAVTSQTSALTPVPLVVMLTSRRTKEGEPSWRATQRLKREAICRELALKGLDSLQINELIKEIGKARPSPRLLQSIAEASQGNPLLLRSLLDRLIADGTVTVEGNLLASQNAHLPAVALDLDVELEARLERVDPDCRDLLNWAALVGDRQPVAMLQAVSGYEEEAFDAAMELAATARVLYEDGDTYRFDHPELREVLYAKMSSRRRRRRHLAVAERLENRFAGSTRDVSAAVAHHLSLAGPEASPADLARTARTAAEQSFAMAAWSDAAAYYDLCLTATTVAGPPEEAYLLWRAGLAHFRNLDHREAQNRLTRAVELARTAGDERLWGRAVLALTKSRVVGGSWLGADIDLEPLQDFIRNSHGDTADLRARAYSQISDAHWAMFDFPTGFQQAQLALETAAGLTDHEVTAEVELAISVQHLAALQLDEAEVHLENCRRSAARMSDTWGKGWAASRLPLLRWCRGDLAGADQEAIRAVAVASEHFDWAEASLATACRVAVAVAQGRLAQAERLGTLAHQQYLRSDYAWTLLVLAPALISGRAYRGDAARVEESITMIAHAGIDSRWPGLAGRAILGDREVVQAALDGPELDGPKLDGQSFDAHPGSSYSLFDLGFAAMQVEVCDVTGDTGVARAALGPLQAAHAAGFTQSLGWVASVPRLLGVVCRCLGRYQEAEMWLRTAVAQADKAPAQAERARAQLNLAEVLLARGDEPGAAAAIDEAAAAFRHFGLTPLLDRSQRLRLAVPHARS
jgi:transcriptional regulator with XRE-family HTH domain/tetratricopeptide (TPR) repeat protein